MREQSFSVFIYYVLRLSFAFLAVCVSYLCVIPIISPVADFFFTMATFFMKLFSLRKFFFTLSFKILRKCFGEIFIQIFGRSLLLLN